MKKIWKNAELIEKNICETEETDYCLFPRPIKPQYPGVPETSGQNTKPESNKKPGCGRPWWPWF